MTRLILAPFLCAAALPLLQFQAQRSQARDIPGTQVVEAIKFLSSYADILPPQDTITGVRAFEKNVLPANIINFAPASRLIFTSGGGDRTERYIFVRTLHLAAGDSFVTWDRDPTSQRLVAPIGKALPGTMGGREGQDAAPGNEGLAGNPGYPGRSAPTIYLVVNRIENGPINIDLRGQNGGDGGIGQTGCDGGLGRAGNSAIAVFGLCQSPAGSGGNGGPGGNGGGGGEGGRGGNGGTLVLLAPAAAIDAIAAQIRVDVSPGKGGSGGPGGEAGRGGEGGAAGRADSPCPSSAPGKNGDAGQRGGQGTGGPDGRPGIFVKTALTDQQVRALQLRGEVRK
jgi:hypothetical protein